MKYKYIIGLFILIALLYAQGSPATGESGVEEVQSGSFFDIAKDWRILSILILIITGVIISLAVMFGKSFEMPELVAFGTTELSQVVSTAVVIAVLIPAITLLDQVLVDTINSSNIPGLSGSCSLTDNCAIKTANHYIEDTVGLTKDSAKDLLLDIEKGSRIGAARLGGFGVPIIYPIPTLQASYSITPRGGYNVFVDQYSPALEYLSSVFAVLISQQFFMSEIAFKIAPTLFLFGVLARSFFITRKLGGLLMAAGIGMMYVLPLMYVFNWYTLSITIYGDSIVTGESGVCPIECQQKAPLFYTSDGRKFYSIENVYEELALSDDEYINSQLPLQELANGSLLSYAVNSQSGPVGLISCENQSYTQYGYCPSMCRERPYPLGQECTEQNSTSDPERACNYIPAECIVIRTAQRDPATAASCPPECWIVPPLKINCDISDAQGSCLNSKNYCRATRPDTPGERLQNCDDKVTGLVPQSTNAWSCPISTDAYSSCGYLLPPKSLIDSNSCKGCLFVEPTQTYNPPVRVDCSERCSKSGVGPPKISAKDFALQTREGMVGPSNLKNVASLLLPALILPLFDIVITLSFIRTFSEMLGGDIEIPGVSKIL